LINYSEGGAARCGQRGPCQLPPIALAQSDGGLWSTQSNKTEESDGCRDIHHEIETGPSFNFGTTKSATSFEQFLILFIAGCVLHLSPMLRPLGAPDDLNYRLIPIIYTDG
jgi:predicted small lipoprotein YifL